MKTLIEGYRIYPGDHCGSAAMRGLLHHYCGLELPESAVFGLGAGLDGVYLSAPDMDPAVMTFGRTASMEADIGRALGVDYREQPEPDDALAWELVREEVIAGRPTMLTGDILYLDYREYKVHFPAHRFVLLGFDDEKEIAWIADRIRSEPEACSYGALIESRNPPEGISTWNLWGRFHDTAIGRSLREAARWAIDLCARRMLGDEPSEIEALANGQGALAVAGVAGIRRLAEEIPGWAARDDARWLASYNSRCIEKFGNGGGNFRRLYAGFLSWARELDEGLVPEQAPERARQAADGWTALSVTLAGAAEEGAPPDVWREAARRATAISEISEIEEDLFTRLAAAAAA
jgi:hypothetical protein